VSLGFKLNPYDPYVANANINGHQCIIVWYIDNTKISYVKASAIDDIIQKLEKIFGTMTEQEEYIHKLFGMQLTFNNNQTLSIDMARYIEEAIQQFPKVISQKIVNARKQKRVYG
jgi:cell division ATPase FtsA